MFAGFQQRPVNLLKFASDPFDHRGYTHGERCRRANSPSRSVTMSRSRAAACICIAISDWLLLCYHGMPQRLARLWQFRVVRFFVTSSTYPQLPGSVIFTNFSCGNVGLKTLPGSFEAPRCRATRPLPSSRTVLSRGGVQAALISAERYGGFGL